MGEVSAMPYRSVPGVDTMAPMVQPGGDAAVDDVEPARWERATALFLRWSDGDGRAMDDLVRLMTPTLWHVVRAQGVDRDEAEDMLRHAIGNVIEKVRYKVPHEGHVWEIDVYGGAHKGLVIAEVELSSIHEEPELPNWVGREVTGESQYSNQSMALGVSNGASLRQLA